MAIRIEVWRENLDRLTRDIEAALKKSARKGDEIRAVIVTKTHQTAILEELIEIGVKNIGESYVQEALQKQDEIRESGIDMEDVEWHMIGHIQSRKAKDVAERFQWVHSIDSLKLARKLNQAAGNRQGNVKALVQLNVSGEESKFGFPAGSQQELDQLNADFELLAELKNIEIRGLMSIPPFEQDSEGARKIYQQTREIRDDLRKKFPELILDELSMGMSNDFSVAIEEGATIIRVGSAVLGRREN